MNLEEISGLLRGLTPRQEKTIRLCFGLGCRRPHSAAEVAKQFGVSAQAIGGLLGAGLRQLAQQGITPGELRQAAMRQANSQGSERLAAQASGPVRKRCSHSGQ